MAVIDDMLSGLDQTTEEVVWNNVFGPQGIFRQHKITVILAAHSGMFTSLFNTREWFNVAIHSYHGVYLSVVKEADVLKFAICERRTKLLSSMGREHLNRAHSTLLVLPTVSCMISSSILEIKSPKPEVRFINKPKTLP